MLQLLKLVRYSRAVRRYRSALAIAREELLLFLALAAVVVFITAVGTWHRERDAQPSAFGSVCHALWWAICNLTTVGYGDVYPVTVGGQIWTTIMLFVELGLVAAPAGTSRLR